MLTFLSGILRDEGGYEFKRAVVESMFDLIKFVPGSKEDGGSLSIPLMQSKLTGDSARTSMRIHRRLRIH